MGLLRAFGLDPGSALTGWAQRQRTLLNSDALPWAVLQDPALHAPLEAPKAQTKSVAPAKTS